jgi:hypothetical protein
MKYAVSLPNGGECGAPRLLSDLARLAEVSGWDAILLEDYIVWQGHTDVATCDPWIALAAMAGCTTRIRLGTGGHWERPCRGPECWFARARIGDAPRSPGYRGILGFGVTRTRRAVSLRSCPERVGPSQCRKRYGEPLFDSLRPRVI